MYLGINNGFSILKTDNLVCYNYLIIAKHHNCYGNGFVSMWLYIFKLGKIISWMQNALLFVPPKCKSKLSLLGFL